MKSLLLRIEYDCYLSHEDECVIHGRFGPVSIDLIRLCKFILFDKDINIRKTNYDVFYIIPS